MQRFFSTGLFSHYCNIYSTLCLAFVLKVKVGEDYAGGINGNKYHFRERALDNGHNETSNKCFCRKGRCLPAGLVDVTECYYGRNLSQLL